MRLVRAIGLGCGLAVMALAVHSWAIASTGAALGADLGVAAVAPGELQIGSGLALQAHGLQPGDRPVTGHVRVRNITGVPVRVRIRALPSTRALDGALDLTATARGRRIALRRTWSAALFRLGVRESTPLRLRARLLHAAQGLLAAVTLEFDAEPVLLPREKGQRR